MRITSISLPHCKRIRTLQDHFHQVLPEAHVEAVNAMYTEAEEERLLGGKPDFVLDAIDNIETKVALLAACHRRGIPVLSSAGAGERKCPILPLKLYSGWCYWLAMLRSGAKVYSYIPLPFSKF